MRIAGSGERQELPKNIHTDAEYARAQGLPAAIADGMHSANWISALLSEVFGVDYIRSGSLRTKFIRPIYVGVSAVTPKAVVRDRTEAEDHSVRYHLDVSCVDDRGQVVVVGEATVAVSPERAAPGSA
jgi:acyl dehydratase